MTPTNLQQWIEHPETLNRDTLYELHTWLTRFPYFQSVRLLYLKNLFLLHDARFGAELRKSVLYVADRRVLFWLIEGDRYMLQERQRPLTTDKDWEEEPAVDRTMSLINSFLSALPEEHGRNAGPDYAADYASYMLKEEEKEAGTGTEQESPRLKGQELIDGFLQNAREEGGGGRLLPVAPGQGAEDVDDEEETTLPAVSEEEPDDSCMTETLAKIYIKQQRYEKALEIIKKLSLNYPKKNAYFADQIRFLEKLIINAKSK